MLDWNSFSLLYKYYLPRSFDVSLANTPKPPHYAVIFTSTPTDSNNDYAEEVNKMAVLAKQQFSFLEIESARENVGISVFYWTGLDLIKSKKRIQSILSLKKRSQSMVSIF